MTLLKAPDKKELLSIMGKNSFFLFETFCSFAEKSYPDLEAVWDIERKLGPYVVRYRKGAKTIFSLFVRKYGLAFLFVLGAKEREAFDAQRKEFSGFVTKAYDAAKTYHDGKWILFDVTSAGQIDDIKKLAFIKRKPKA